MRTTKSFASFAKASQSAGFQCEISLHKRPSFDNLVIPGRTRLPSSTVGQVEPVDLQIAMTLLNAQAHALPSRTTSRPSLRSRMTWPAPGEIVLAGADEPTLLPPSSGSFRFEDSGDEYSITGFRYVTDEQGSDTSQYHRPLIQPEKSSSSSSGAWECDGLGLSYDGANYLPSDASRTTSFTWPTKSDIAAPLLRAEPAHAAEEYSRLAAIGGLNSLAETPDTELVDIAKSVDAEGNDGHSRLESIKDFFHTKRMKNFFHMKRSVHRVSSAQSMKTRKVMDDIPLVELCLLGGLGPLRLPTPFSPNRVLLIPSSLAAAASYIVEHGPLIPEIFRLNGIESVVVQLHNHYANQCHSSANARDFGRIRSTIRANALPTHIQYTIHEIASLFKRVVRRLPGGLLGSSQLLDALNGIRVNAQLKKLGSDNGMLRARLIALALSCVTSDHRFSVICATLGLYSWIGNAAETSIDSPSKLDKLMTYQSLSRLLAPLLVGNILDDIKEGKRDANGLKIEKRDTTGEEPELAKQNNADEIAIAFMLVSSWEEIVGQLQILKISSLETMDKELYVLGMQRDGII